MDDYKIITYRGYFQYRLVSLLTYVKLLEGEGAAVVLPLASSYYYTTIVYGGIPAGNLPVKVFALDTLLQRWSLVPLQVLVMLDRIFTSTHTI